ncbi:PEP-CTERM sorting domain-containing protein [Kiritimatiellaeota bacterium B1221]|nr:PEP-CTERM sorting domain-containing protein [Kiritimatiellaeota bacterium B1221]
MKKTIVTLTMRFTVCLNVLMPARGALLVYEGFNYGLADNTAIGGTATTATGLTGNYSASNTPSKASSSYRTAGLSFGSVFYAGSGGSLNQRALNSGVSYLGVALDTAVVHGDLWGSHLFNIADINSINTTGQTRLNSTATGGSSSSWFNMADDISGSGQYPQVAYDGSTYSTQSGFEYVEGTTYLMVSKFTQVGEALSAGTPGVASLWIFSQAQYEAWVAGGGSEASLSAFSDGFATVSTTSGSYEFDDFLQFAAYSTSGSVSSLYTDEVRYGTTLGDVVAVPEPSTILMLLAGCCVLALGVRRRV